MNFKSNKTFLVVGGLFFIIEVIALFNGTNFGAAMAEYVCLWALKIPPFGV